MSNVPATIPETPLGMEDFNESDLVMPRIDIVSKEAVFKDSLSGEEFPELNAVILGLIKGRVLFDADVEDKMPFCKSVDFKVGTPRRAVFPWKASGFDPATTPEGATLPCDDCKLPIWGSHPKNDTPWCSETWTFAIMQILEDGGYAPAVMTIQRTGLKPAKAYLTAYARTKTPTFFNATRVTLDKQSRGSNVYSVPRFVKTDQTDPEDYDLFANTYLRIRDMVMTPRDLEPDAAVADPPAATTPAPAPQPTAPAPAPQPDPSSMVHSAQPAPTAPAAAADGDDELPF